VPENSRNNLRAALVRIKREVMLQRPSGLGSLGTRSFIQRPRILHGRRSIYIGQDTHIFSGGLISALSRYASRAYDPTIRIGNAVYIGRHVYLTAVQGITIEDDCVLSEHVYITDLNHGFDPRAGAIIQQDLESKGPVSIGRNCFLGYRAVVMPGVSLGEWCVVGANSVVTHSFPAYSMIGGAPARVIKVYSQRLGEWVRPDMLHTNSRGLP
jgi:acetyltransferase-like isoleucine patch superfamily enzyme